MKILIAVPTVETIYPDTFKAIYDLDKGDHEVIFDFVRGYDCATARNNIVHKAKAENADYILMVDNDVTLPRDALMNLLEGSNDVCFGAYPQRNAYNRYEGKVCLYHLGEHNYTNLFSGEELRLLRDAGENKIKIHGGGMGCALIRTDIFDRIEYPWFDWVNYKDLGILSEDLYFCEQCMYNGIPIYADTRVLCGHMFRHLQEVV